MNEVNNSNYLHLLLAFLSIALFIIIVYFLSKIRSRSNASSMYRISIGYFYVLILVSLLIFQISLIGAVVGGGVVAGYIIIVLLFLEAALGLKLLINAARRINLKYNSNYQNQIFSSSKYNSLERWVPLMFVVFSVLFMILIFSLYLFGTG